MTKRRELYLLIALAAISIVVFLPSITGAWVFDDRPLINENPYVHSFEWLSRWFVTDFWNVGEDARRFGSPMIYWRPGISATYAFDWTISNGNPVLFHVMNLLYHAGVALLGYVVLRRWIGRALPAFAAALLFAIHPTKAESVAWIAGRTDVICMLAVLVATQGIAWRLRGRRGGLALEVGGTVLAYLCKEQAIVLPVFAAIEAWIAAERPALNLTAIKKLIPKVVPQAVLAVLYLGIRTVFLPIRSSAGAPHLELGDHVLAILETVGRFATLTFAPHDLSLQHGLVHSIGGEPLHSMPYVITGALVLAAAVAAMIAARKRWPALTLGIAFFFVTVAPTSNLVYTGMETLVSERFLYLPIFGLAWVAGELLARVPDRLLRPAYALVAAVAIACAALSLSRSADFIDEQQFWARELELHPDSNQAMQYAITTANREARFRDSLQLLLRMHTMLDRYDRDRARDILFAFQVAEVTSKLLPDRQKEQLLLVDKFLENVNAGEPAQLNVLEVRLGFGALQEKYRKELERFAPRFLVLRSAIAGRVGNDELAINLAEQAIQSCPQCSSTLTAGAIAYARAGRYDEALRLLDQSKNLGPEDPIGTVRDHVAKAIAARDDAAKSEGPAQLQARARELAALELWGRAYEVLAPYKDQIKTAPRFALGFAELAFRAGDTAVATEVLAANVAPAEVDEKMAEWARTMGWQ